jgi:hypothetical protein
MRLTLPSRQATIARLPQTKKLLSFQDKVLDPCRHRQGARILIPKG